MTQKLKSIFLTFMGLSVLLTPALVATPVFADGSSNTLNQFCNGINQTNGGAADPTGNVTAPGTNGCGNPKQENSAITNLLNAAVNILSIVVGVIAVIMIIVAGFRYITSGGESSKVSGAKNAIIYALVGLLIVALAQIIVRFVINRALGGLNG